MSYHHGGDQAYYNAFSATFHDQLQLITDTSLDRARDSDDPAYIMRVIRENHLAGASCTVVLCGAGTPGRKFVDWEIQASLYQGMALVGLMLPTLALQSNGGTYKPLRLQDNIDSGHAIWGSYNDVRAKPGALTTLLEEAKGKGTRLIDNTRERRVRNS